MEHSMPDYKSHNVIVPQVSDRGDDGFGRGFGGLFAFLIALGLINRDGSLTGKVANNEIISTLASNMHTSIESVKGMLQNLQIATCEQTQSITGAIHASSTANLVGQNVIGEKVSDVKYSGAMNAKDAEKTTLIDGSLTRKNDDDNTNEIKNNQILGFTSLQKELCETNHNIDTKTTLLSSQYAEGTCKILGEIKDLKYENLLVAERNQSATMGALKDIGFQNANIAKDTIIREKDDQLRMSEQRISAMQFGDIKEEIEDLKRCRAKEAENNFLSNNIVTNIGNNVNSAFDRRFGAIERSLDILSHNFNLIIANNKIGNGNS